MTLNSSNILAVTGNDALSLFQIHPESDKGNKVIIDVITEFKLNAEPFVPLRVIKLGAFAASVAFVSPDSVLVGLTYSGIM